jgi:DNA-nicking Smr family endonuclease
MARKKSSKQQVASPQEFSSSPFKDLKGLSALVEQKPLTHGPAVRQATTDVNEPPASSSGHDFFAEEMSFLGVKPLAERVAQEPVSAQGPERMVPPPATMSREERETAAFLDAVGCVEKVFKDEWPEDEPVKQAVPRRMKQVGRGRLKPEAELDLHGLTVDEASAKVRFFLRDVRYHGFLTVLIITGKGLHSSDGPVLRQAMEKLLNQQREHVLEWSVAPRRFGGDGALIVFLRQVVAEA